MYNIAGLVDDGDYPDMFDDFCFCFDKVKNIGNWKLNEMF